MKLKSEALCETHSEAQSHSEAQAQSEALCEAQSQSEALCEAQAQSEALSKAQSQSEALCEAQSEAQSESTKALVKSHHLEVKMDHLETEVVHKLDSIQVGVDQANEKLNQLSLALKQCNECLLDEIRMNAFTLIQSNQTIFNPMMASIQSCKDQLESLLDPGKTCTNDSIQLILINFKSALLTSLQQTMTTNAGSNMNNNREVMGPMLRNMELKMNEMLLTIQSHGLETVNQKQLLQQVINNTNMLHEDIIQVQSTVQESIHQITYLGCSIREILDTNNQLVTQLNRLEESIHSTSEGTYKQLQDIRVEMMEIQKEMSIAPDRARRLLVSELTGIRESLKVLVEDTHKYPTLAIIVPKLKSDKTLLQKMDIIHDVYYLIFVCSHTYQLVPCGKKGVGYEIKMQKEWFAKLAPVMVVLLTLVRVVLGTHGIPFPIPIEGLDVSTKASDLIDASLGCFQKDHTTNLPLPPPPPPASTSSSDVATREAYEIMKGILEEVDPLLKYTGLTKEICMVTGKVGWVKNDPAVISSFRACHGERMPVASGSGAMGGSGAVCGALKLP